MFENGCPFFSNVPAQLETVTWSSLSFEKIIGGSGQIEPTKKVTRGI
jgi:hypothetical protein